MAADDSGPKIIVDEDWKSRVQREKEEAEKKASAQPPSPAKTGGEEEAGQRQPASFAGLVSSIAFQAMYALGAVAPQGNEEVYIDLEEAKFAVDMLMILREKTKNNLTAEEQGMLSATLADLQQGYVVRAQQIQEAALQGVSLDPAGPRGRQPR